MISNLLGVVLLVRASTVRAIERSPIQWTGKSFELWGFLSPHPLRLPVCGRPAQYFLDAALQQLGGRLLPQKFQHCDQRHDYVIGSNGGRERLLAELIAPRLHPDGPVHVGGGGEN